MKGFTRVIAVGNKAGRIVDYLRQENDYDNVAFCFLGSDSSCLLSHGNLSEPYILFSEKFYLKYIEAIHVDNEMPAIVIASLDEQTSQPFLFYIVGEVWGYADKVYCFLILLTTKEGEERRNNAIDLFHNITNWSDIPVLQDIEGHPDNANFKDGLAQLLKCCLGYFLDREPTN